MKRLLLAYIFIAVFLFQNGSITHANTCKKPSRINIEHFGSLLSTNMKGTVDMKVNGLFMKVEREYSNKEQQFSIYKKIIKRIEILEKKDGFKTNKRILIILSYIQESLEYKIKSIERQDQCLLDNIFTIDEREQQEISVGNIKLSFDGDRKISWNKISDIKKYIVSVGTHKIMVNMNYYSIREKTDVGNSNGELSKVTVTAYNYDDVIVATGKMNISYQGNHCSYKDRYMSTDMYHNQKKYSYEDKSVYGGTMKYRKNFKCKFGKIINLDDSHIELHCNSGYYSENNRCNKKDDDVVEIKNCEDNGNLTQHGKKTGGQEVITVNYGKKIVFREYSCENGSFIFLKETLQKLDCNSGYVAGEGICEKIDNTMKTCTFVDSDSSIVLAHKEKKWLTKDTDITHGMKHSNVLVSCSNGILEMQRELSEYVSCNNGYYNDGVKCLKSNSTQKSFTFEGPLEVIVGKEFQVTWKALGYKYCIGYGRELDATDGGTWTRSTDLGNTTSIQSRYSAYGSQSFIANKTPQTYSLGLQCYTDDVTSESREIEIKVVNEETTHVEGQLLVNDTFGVDDKYAKIGFIVDIVSNDIDKIEIINIDTEGGVTVRNDDNISVSYPEEINNGDEWELKADGEGNKRITSYTYRITFEQDAGSTIYKKPITVKEYINRDLGSYRED